MSGSGRRLERMLAGLLRYGARAASVLLGVGLAVEAAGGSGRAWMAAGIGLMILLPVLRVGLMMCVFAAGREWRFAAIAALVLLVIAAGFAIGMRHGPRKVAAATGSSASPVAGN